MLQAKLDKALPNTVNLPVDWSDDEKRVLVWSGGASDPGRYYLLDRSTSQMHAVVDPYPQVDPAKLSPVKSVRYRARDGLQIPAYLTLPIGRDAKSLPLIVMPHGGPFDRDHWEYDPIVQFLASRGYAVLQPEFRGSTGYGKDFVSKGYGEWGRKMQDDLDDGVDWLAKTGQIDPRRVCMVGGSYGGYAALWAAVRNPDRYRCAASMAGVSDVPALLRSSRDIFSATRYYREWRTQVGGEGKADLGAVSPINFANRIRVPVLIAHGEEDARVPVKQSRAMVDALAKAHADVTSVFYKDSGHGFDSSEDLDDWLRRLEAFLAKHNPA
jgi:dipeptidyl aminopeptidase/acylaminoacyl peptidase